MTRSLGLAAFLVPARFLAAQQAAPGAQVPTLTDSLTVSANVPDRFIDRHSALEFSLSRALRPNEGAIAVMIGNVDVSDLLDRAPTRVAYRPRLTPLPAGERDVVVYRHAAGHWVELQRFALKVLRRGGLVRVSLAPSLTVGNNGQLAEGRSAGVPRPARTTFQNLTLTSGLRSTHEGVGWSLETQSTIVGASRQEQSLQFAQRGPDAPKVDLSDYLLTVRARRARVSLGHVSLGSNRHLVNAFASRGAILAADGGPVAVSLGALHGSSIVGWNHLVGLGKPHHRVVAATLRSELIPKRAGALRVDLSLLDGSLLPLTSFTQGAIVDAERSSGAGLQLSASTADHRLRISGGYARSRFTNPSRDAELLGDTVIRRVRPETRGARYLEVTAELLHAARVPLLGTTSLNAAYRHERVDPLYRSVAVSTQADQQQHAFDVNGSVGSLLAQLSVTRSNDNLDGVPSVLRSLNRQANASLTLPFPAISRLGRFAPVLPTVTYSAARTHQYAAGTPTNGDFRPSDLPNQASTSHNADAQWQAGRWRMSYRFSASDQDNRQAQREQADFTTQTHALTMALTLGSATDVSADAAAEHQHAAEHDETSNVRRIGLTFNWRPWQATALVVGMNTVHSHDATRPKGSRNNDVRLELSQGIALSEGVSRGQVFLRYALTSMTLATLDQAGSQIDMRLQQQWTVSFGLSLRVF